MGNIWSRAKKYSPNPDKGSSGSKKCCASCVGCSPFAKVPKEFDPPIPQPPVYVIDDKDETVHKDSSILKVLQVDAQVKVNAQEHHTDQFHLVQREKPVPVLRRGQQFDVKVTFNRPYEEKKDTICLVFTAKDAPNANYSQKTIISVPVSDEPVADKPASEWSAFITPDNSSAIIRIITSSETIVGAWGFDIDTKLKQDPGSVATVRRFTLPDPVYVLFNPWCKEDAVYLDDDVKLEEYVLNDSGLMWRGTHTRLRPSPWNYAQFDEGILECAIYLLNHVGKLRKGGHNDPVQVVRHLSAVTNAQDDNGVIVGNWSSDYSGGESPTVWTGSKVILQQFYKTRKSVKYGQCWVFSGILTTICRALGIPSRPVTNFSSAHDTHQSLTVDIFCDDTGSPISDLNQDSIWNYHVWNEVWMTRPDLEPGDYGGWQAIDSTPQEESAGAYRCGPASVAAIKRGEIKKGFDVDFLFAEVNADKVFWRYHGPTQPLKLISKQMESIGMYISTKAIGRFDREDITSQYKYPERTVEERNIMLTALRQTGNKFSRYYLNDNFEDIEFDFQLYDDIIIGESFKVALQMKNKTSEKDHTVSATLRVDTMLYNGDIKSFIKKQEFETNLKAGTEHSFVLEIKYEDYDRKLSDQYAFNIAAMANVKETNFDYFGQDDFRVRMPDIKIEPEGEIMELKEFSVKVHFKNPLSKALRKGEFVIEGPGLGASQKIKLAKDVAPGQDAVATCKFTPLLAGSKSIVAKFTSKELRDVDGFKTISVLAKSSSPALPRSTETIPA